jgi:hypothetical protein
MATNFRITRGLEKDLPDTKTDGQIYYCHDTGNLYIDYRAEDGTEERKLISSEYAKALRYINEDDEEVILNPEDLTKVKIVRW